ncbi:MAG: outer membrane beta-barrel protein [Alphaproteobacteria bacterium]|nr:outer membrane beta-barrel protein [Alphaproteobacteria bacterium]
MKWYIETIFDKKRKPSKKQSKSEPYEILNNIKIRIKEPIGCVSIMLPLRYLAATIMVFGTFSAHANDDANKTSDTTKVEEIDTLKGFTIGADLVYSHSEAKHDEFVSEYSCPNEGVRTRGKSIPGEIQHERCNIDPSLNIGYSHLYNNWYIGATGEISLGSGNKKNSGFHSDKEAGNATANTKISGFSGGIKIKGGYYLSDLKSVAYGIAGIKWKNIHLRFDVNDVSGSKACLRRPSFALGVGLEKPIGKNLSVSAEWEHTWRNSRDRSNVSNANATGSLRTKQRLSEHDFKIGMKYYI